MDYLFFHSFSSANYIVYFLYFLLSFNYIAPLFLVMNKKEKNIKHLLFSLLSALILCLPTKAFNPPIQPAAGKGPAGIPVPWWEQQITSNEWLDLFLGFDGDGRVEVWEAGLSAALILLFGYGLITRAGLVAGKAGLFLVRINQVAPRLFKFGKFLLRAETLRIYFFGRLESYESRHGRSLGLSRYTYGVFDHRKSLTEKVVGLFEWIVDDIMFYTAPKFIIGGVRNFSVEVYRLLSARNSFSLLAGMRSASTKLLAYIRGSLNTARIKESISEIKILWTQRPVLVREISVFFDNLRTTIRYGRLYEALLGDGSRGSGLIGKMAKIGNITAVFNLFVLTINQQLKYGLFPNLRNYWETFRDSWRIGALLGVGLEAATPYLTWLSRFPLIRRVANLQIKNIFPAVAGEYATLTVVGDVIIEEEIRSKLDPAAVARRSVGLSAKKSLLSGTIDAAGFRMNVNPVFYDLMNEVGVENANIFYSVVDGDLHFMRKGDIQAIKKLLSSGLSMEDIALFYKNYLLSLEGLKETDLNLLKLLIKGIGAENAGTYWGIAGKNFIPITNSDVSLMKSLLDAGLNMNEVAVFYKSAGYGIENAGEIEVKVLANAIKMFGPKDAATLYTTVGTNLPIKNEDLQTTKKLLDYGISMEEIAVFYKSTGKSLGGISGTELDILSSAIKKLGAFDASVLYRFNNGKLSLRQVDIDAIKSICESGVGIESVAAFYRQGGRVDGLNTSQIQSLSHAINIFGGVDAASFIKAADYKKQFTASDLSAAASMRNLGADVRELGIFASEYKGNLSDLNYTQQKNLVSAIKIMGPEKAAELYNNVGADKINRGSLVLGEELLHAGVSPSNILAFYQSYFKSSKKHATVDLGIYTAKLAEIINSVGADTAGSALASIGADFIVNYHSYSDSLSMMLFSLGGEKTAELIRYGGADVLVAYRNNPSKVLDMVKFLGAKQTGIIFAGIYSD